VARTDLELANLGDFMERVATHEQERQAAERELKNARDRAGFEPITI
jgi:hypothetical protein